MLTIFSEPFEGKLRTTSWPLTPKYLPKNRDILQSHRMITLAQYFTLRIPVLSVLSNDVLYRYPRLFYPTKITTKEFF